MKRYYYRLYFIGPLKSVGHTATLFTSKSRKPEIMIVIFGYSPMFGFLNTVQEYHFGMYSRIRPRITYINLLAFLNKLFALGTREWKIVKTEGFPVKGGYGHSSAWDPFKQRIYVYGGYVSTNTNSAQMSDRLYSYDPANRTWYVPKICFHSFSRFPMKTFLFK